MIKRVALIVLIVLNLGALCAQEFRCSVQVNYQKLMSTTQQFESTDKRIFESMKQALEDFINQRRWTTLEMQQQERIDCTFSLILNERTSLTDFKGQISVQMRRPVYNSSYTTGLFNYIETPDFMFVYNESQPLDYDPNFPIDGNVRLMYETLVTYNQITDKLEPMLADSFTKTDSSITVHLDEKAKWNNGTPVTVEDVIFTFHVDSILPTPRHGNWQYLSSVKADGNNNIVFNFASNNRNPLIILNAIAETSILPKAVFEPIIAAARDEAEKEGRARRAQVLEAVLVANEPSGALAEKRAEVTKLFAEHGNIVNATALARLQELGISHKNGEDYLLPSEIIKRAF